MQSPPESISTDHLRMLRQVAAEVTEARQQALKAEAAASFVARFLSTLYSIGPSDSIEEDGSIRRGGAGKKKRKSEGG